MSRGARGSVGAIATMPPLTFTASELPVPASGWPAKPSSIHADARGELFMTTEDGDIYQIEAQP